MHPTNCDFCNSTTDQAQEITRGKYIKIFHPRKVVANKQLLYIPIRHVENVHDLSKEEVLELFELLEKINTSFKNKYKMIGYNFFVNNGIQAGQHIPHVHFHFIPRYRDEEISPLKKLNEPDKYNIEKMTEEEIKVNIEEIRNVLN